MIYFAKSDGKALSAVLDAGKNRDDANVYRSGKVFEQIKRDFHGKCYLCEDNEMTSIQIEHFEPHRGDLAKKYAWNNLFYSCGHCNGVKHDQYWPLLNCTSKDDKIWESIEIRFKAFPKATVEVLLTTGCPNPVTGENTRRLLEKILTGKNATPMQREQAANLRKKMLRAFDALSAIVEKKKIAEIHSAIADDAAFAGMLRWYLKNDFPEIYASVESR